jgi:hypothetical protein
MGAVQSRLGRLELHRGIHIRTFSKANDSLCPDEVHIESAIYSVLTPQHGCATQHFVSRFVVSFSLNKEMYADLIEAEFIGVIVVKNYVTGNEISARCLTTHWDLWKGRCLEAGKRYVFEAIGELPSKSPCSLRTRSGGVYYEFRVRFCRVGDCTRLSSFEKALEVWNPYLVAEEPRSGLNHTNDLTSEMIGATVELGRRQTAFIRYPDQCYDGIKLEMSTP